MKDLVARTGLTRDTIHFYISEGLVPAPTMKRRNMAWYGPEHLDRLNTIKRLQQERFLPLRAIKEVLTDGEREASVSFTEGQRRLIERLRVELADESAGGLPRVALAEAPFADAFDPAELEELAQRGIVDLQREGGRTFVSADDADILSGLAEVKRVVDRPEGSWRPEDWGMLDKLAGQLLEYEVSVFAQRFPDVGTRPIDEVIGTTIPVINRVFGILHMKKIRGFIANFAVAPDAPAQAAVPESPSRAPSASTAAAKRTRRSPSKRRA